MRKRALTPYLRSASRNALPRFGSDVVDARYSSIAQADSPDFDRRVVSSVIRPPARYGVVRPSTLGGVAKRLTTTAIPIVKPNQRASRPKNSVIATLVAGSRLRRLPEPWVCGSTCRGDNHRADSLAAYDTTIGTCAAVSTGQESHVRHSRLVSRLRPAVQAAQAPFSGGSSTSGTSSGHVTVKLRRRHRPLRSRGRRASCRGSSQPHSEPGCSGRRPGWSRWWCYPSLGSCR